MRQALAEGIRLFNTRKFFEAHEVLETVWLKAQGDERVFLHGLIQIAAAFHHHGRNNLTGLRSLLEKGLKKLERFGAEKDGVNLDGLRKQLNAWRDFLNRADSSGKRQAPPLPRILRAVTSDE